MPVPAVPEDKWANTIRFSGPAIRGFGGRCEVCRDPMRKHSGWIDMDKRGKVVNCSNGRQARNRDRAT